MPNGRLEASALGTIPGTSRRLRKELVPQTAALRSAFAKRFGKALVVTDGYRDYATQERIFRERYTPDRVTGVDPRWWNGRVWWRLPGVAAAAVPGTSNHGWGQAIDFGSNVNRGGSAEHDWMRANAGRFGWSWPSWAGRSLTYEPWHWEAVAVPVSNYRDYVLDNDIEVPDLPELEPLQEDQMPSPKDLWDHEVGGVPARQRLTDASSRALKAQQNAAGALAETRALAAAVAALATAQGVDGAAVIRTVDAAVKKALADLEITLRVGD